eukprot:g413.t1
MLLTATGCLPLPNAYPLTSRRTAGGFPEVPSNDCKATVLPPLFLMAIFSLYVGAFLMGLFREAFTTLPRKFNARYISGRISWLAGMLMFLYNLPFMLFVFKLGLKRLYTDPETLDQDSEEVMEVFGMLLVEVMLGMRAFAVCLVVAILLSFARWSAIHEASLGLVTSCAATSASAATSSAFVARKAEEFYRPRIQACVHTLSGAPSGASPLRSRGDLSMGKRAAPKQDPGSAKKAKKEEEPQPEASPKAKGKAKAKAKAKAEPKPKAEPAEPKAEPKAAAEPPREAEAPAPSAAAEAEAEQKAAEAAFDLGFEGDDFDDLFLEEGEEEDWLDDDDLLDLESGEEDLFLEVGRRDGGTGMIDHLPDIIVGLQVTLSKVDGRCCPTRFTTPRA